jgi:PAS domain S-box-containing protein
MAALKLNASVGLLAIGLALLALELAHPRFAPVALVAAVVGSLSLFQDVFGAEFRIDELLGRDYLALQTEHPGRMAAMLAALLVPGGFIPAWHAWERATRERLIATAVVGSLLASAGLSTLLGYGFGLQTVFAWGTNTATSPIAASELILLGLALLALAWRHSSVAPGDAPAWTPLPVVCGCVAVTVVCALGLDAREESFTNATTLARIEQFAGQIKDSFDKQEGQFERIARTWGDRAENSDEGWKADARVQLVERGSAELGCVAIAFVDLKRRTVWSESLDDSGPSRGFDHTQKEERREAIALAESRRGPAMSATTDVLVAGRNLVKGVVIYSPVIRAGTITGFLAAEFAYQEFFRSIATAKGSPLRDDYHVKVAIAGETAYARADAEAPPDARFSLERVYQIAARRIRISLTPTAAALSQTQRPLPEFALVTGFVVTTLLGLSVHLYRSARTGQHAAEHSSRKLHAENEERRRIEARLKISDERLRLALDSTQIGIFEWSVAAGHIYYSPGLWAMLGYEHVRMPSTVEAWQSLVHPEDLPLYRRRTESQLQGLTAFIEPEYRVRARDGNWRWVYARSKTVKADSAGRPTRIIGTVQDITARREAELALRESQAEARKLSLVAAKTDNPVMIGSSDGRIEWVNEAFCRVMEYAPEEVVGRNPAHFMVGPETNPRTVVRIRAAMARGQGISTDVVNYSKSGRKYHLHVEIQPVRGTTGEIENFIAIETDITARVETEQQLRRAKREADDASRAKSEFLASMSHEIRTPMNGVIGMTSLLMETTLTAEQRDFVNTIRSSGEALLTIINDILDFSKIESGRMELEHAPFDLALCLEEALDLFALQASSRKLELGYHLEASVPAWIVGDVTRLRQVVVNLVNNAVKFTPSGSISLEVRRARREPTPIGFEPALAPDPTRIVLEFCVRDTGIGIPADRVDRLFKAFSQVDSSTTRKYGGTGLGLAICQRLCELMGGSIRVESNPGQGSSFIFTIQTEAGATASESGLPMLPGPLHTGTVLCVEDHPVTAARLRTTFEKWGVACAVVPNPAEALSVARLHSPTLLVVDAGELDAPTPVEPLAELTCPRLILYPFGQTAPTGRRGEPLMAGTSKPIRTQALLQSIIGLFQAQSLSTGAAPEATVRPIGEEIPLEILLAEDNAVNQKVALRFLERLGYRADAVANGLEAVTTLEHRRYDLVLMDVQMPEMDGYEATRQIRARLPAERQPKIFALTANAMQGDRELALAAGMDDYISKPVKVHEISAAIHRHFGKTAEQCEDSQLIG